ncbi:PP2C family protein-serine/threonine phosphatase [Actinoplanes sp. NPDC020271]|uniref:PP2C family protein-serine/threonine phosphatase n=1 Tax=Actinoplanes sp. NPDC020271 TaxID=3363896 RepID=UPI00379BE293
MTTEQPDWADTIHRLWASVSTITSREELSDLVLPPLLGMPGAVGAWGLRHTTGAAIDVYRWAGLPLAGAARSAALALAGGESKHDWLAEHGVRHVAVTRFDVGGDVGGTMMVLLDETGDPELAAVRLGQVADVTREAIRRLAAHRAEQAQQTRDALLAEASLQMDAVLDRAQTMRRVARMAVPAIAEGCLVYLCEDTGPELRSAVHIDMRRLNALLAGERIAARLQALARDAVGGRPGVRAVPGAGIVDVQVLRARGRTSGVLIFMFDRNRNDVPPARFLRDLAHRAALALDNGELYEQRRREVVAMQQHLLPRRLPSVDGLEFAASYTVGDRVMEVGGDFYDVVVRADGVVAALIGDVCGRGVDAAALTGMSRHTLGALLHEGLSPARALSRLNDSLRREGSWRFLTAGIGLFRPDGDGFTVQWMSCGHPAPLILRRGAPAEAGRGGGTPIGVIPRLRIGRSRIRLGAGDTLVMYTDGLTESRDAQGRMFEDEALPQALERLRDVPPETLVRELSAAAAGFGVSGADDIAVLAIGVAL